MPKTIIAEGRTTNEAIEKGLKELNVSREMVEIKELANEDKRSFFSILTPRVVKVQLTVKENQNKKNLKNEERKKIVEASEEDRKKAKESLEQFLDKFVEELNESIKYKITPESHGLVVSIEGEDIGFLIGYRGDTLYSFQNILLAIANKKTDIKVRVILDVAGYKEKRVQTLEELADKIAKTVERTHKSVTLEPMQAYERKIIHNRLQDNPNVTTKSVGEEPRRKVVISLIKK